MDEGDVIPLLAFFVFSDGHLELDTVNNSNKIQFCSRKKRIPQLYPDRSALLLSSLPSLFLSSESRMWIDFHWSNINISWRIERRSRRREEGKKVERWKWSIHF